MRKRPFEDLRSSLVLQCSICLNFAEVPALREETCTTSPLRSLKNLK